MAESPTLVEYIGVRFNLTADQEYCLHEIERFLNSKSKCFILKGYAGTGKTFLTKCLADYFKTINWEVRLMAPTGRAARILAMKTKMDAYTIHKSIYNLDELDEVVTIKNGKEKYKFRFRLTADISNVNTVVIIDEASMISDVEQESDFFVFGSGRLLNDIMTLFAPKNKPRNIKLFFIGDDAQLPPVSDKISGALSPEYLRERFEIDVSQYQLKEVVRQQEQNEILPLSMYLRTQLLDKDRSTFKLPETKKDVHYLDASNVVNVYLEKIRENGIDNSIIINYKNFDAYELNIDVRKQLFPGKSIPQPGDVMIITQNNYNYDVELLNGTFVKVKEVYDDQIVRSGIPSYTADGEDVKVTQVFRKLVLEVPVERGSVDLECFLHESFLNDPEAQMSYEDNIASYIDFKIRNPNLKPKTKEFKDALRTDPYFNAVKAKYGYAITCHKAQGGEWDSAIINMDVSQGKLSEMFLRWTYTAVTRAKKELYLYNVPTQTLYSKIVYEPIKIASNSIEGTKGGQLQLDLSEANKAFLISSGLESAKMELKFQYFHLLAQLLGSGIDIVKREGHPYHEKYTFNHAGKECGLTFWYNGKGKLTKKEKTSGKQHDQELLMKVLSLTDVSVNFTIGEFSLPKSRDAIGSLHESDSRKNEEVVFSDDKKSLRSLYEDLKEIAGRKEITIKKVLHMQYKERYFFLRNNEHACVDFVYDGKGNFTWVTGVAKECNSQDLLDDLEKCILDLKTL